jgi:nitrogen fixation NifU-like protein
MYRQDILEHYKDPDHFGVLDPHTLAHNGENPLCGDTLEVTLVLDDEGNIEDVGFEGQGCAISQAATDILLGRILEEDVESVLTMDEDALLDELGIDVSPLRVKCALLPLVTVQDGIEIHQGTMDPVDVTRTED